MTLAWYRSWPDQVPDGLAHVIDGLPRLVMRDKNYATLADYQPWPQHDPGWCLLEWDIALASEERQRFEQHALSEPGRVLVAPYPLYPAGKPPAGVHRTKGRPISPGERWAETFGFGCIYFPQAVLDRWWAEPPATYAKRGYFTDTTFATWYRTRYGLGEVDWSVHPQHLHGD